MTDEQVAKLRDGGFVFSMWHIRYDQLRRYKDAQGGSLPRSPHNIDTARVLARWGHAHGEWIKWMVLQREYYSAVEGGEERRAGVPH